MKPSPLRHPLAILRTMIGLNQTEMAELCGCSSQSIQSVELLRMRLTVKMATKISKATAISLEWLLDGAPEAPARKDPYVPAAGGFLGTEQTYSKETFENYRAILEATRTGGKMKLGRTLVSQNPNDLPKREFYKADPLQLGRQEIERSDKLLIKFCGNLLQATLNHRQGLVLRWHLKNFLRKQCKIYGISVEASDTARGGSSETERSPKTAKRPSKPLQD